jgi:hypothetical protein
MAARQPAFYQIRFALKVRWTKTGRRNTVAGGKMVCEPNNLSHLL